MAGSAPRPLGVFINATRKWKRIEMADDLQDETPADAPLFLTTREVADLLRVRERKVYDLAAAGEIPHRRITGKLLFPRAALLHWVDGGGTPGDAERPAVLAGSHDPLLDWAIRESGAGLATLLNGSLDGLACFAQGDAAMAGMHVPEADGWNLRTVAAHELRGCVLIAWARRRRGLLLAGDGSGIAGIGDLRGRRVVMRQPGAGGAAIFGNLMAEAGMKPGDVTPAAGLARTEADAAAAVASGEADAALGIEAMARQFGLRFVPLVDEQFDLLVDRRSYFTEPLQTLFGFLRTAGFAAKAERMGGYDVSAAGAVRWLSP